MEHVAVDLQRILAWKYGTTATGALRGEGKGRDRSMAADAPVAAMEARTRQELFGCLPHLGETDGAGEREARVTQGLAGSVYKKATHRVDCRAAPARPPPKRSYLPKHSLASNL